MTIVNPPADGDRAQCEDTLLAYRDQFPILAQTNYLISNSLGAVPKAAAQALQRVLRNLGIARRQGLGRNLVDDGRRHGRPRRPFDRRGAGRSGISTECDAGPRRCLQRAVISVKAAAASSRTPCISPRSST